MPPATLLLIAAKSDQNRNANAANKMIPPCAAKLMTSDVESKNFIPDKVVFTSLSAPNLSKASEKFSGPYPKIGLSESVDLTTLPDKPKLGPISTGKFFLINDKLRFTIVKNIPSTITVMGSKNLEILNLFSLPVTRLSRSIITVIPAIAAAHKIHQLRISRTAKATTRPAILKNLRTIFSLRILPNKGSAAAASKPSAFTEPTVLKA